MDKNKQRKLFGVSFTALLSVLLLFFITSCEKPPEFEGELITQTFGLYTSSNIPDKSWDDNSWVWNYNTTPATLTLTGTGASTGQNYTLETTIQALQKGTASVTMLRGTYDISYTTPHIKSTHTAYVDQNTPSDLERQPWLSENIDIVVNMQSVSVTGSPVTLTATVNDLLIVADIPNIERALITVTNFDNLLPLSKLLPYLDRNFRWGYFAMDNRERGIVEGFSGLEIRLNFSDGTPSKFIDCSQWELGKVYHIQSHFGGTMVIDIPDMEVVPVIVD